MVTRMVTLTAWLSDHTKASRLQDRKFLLLVILWMAICPCWGQTNLRFKSFLEGERLMVSLDVELLGRPMLFVRHGIGQHHVVWIKHRDYLNLEVPSIHSESGVDIPADRDSNVSTNILGRFPIVREKSDAQSLVIDITDLVLRTPVRWNKQIPESVISDGAYIVGTKVLDNELIIITKRSILEGKKRKTLDVDFSLYILPEPMRPRLFDHRMGFFCEDEYSDINQNPITEVASIMRWRLEKKYQDRAVSEPVHPILFFLDPTIPHRWRPYVRAGIMEWTSAFEAAGFKDAIEVREFSPNDTIGSGNSVTYSVIRWNNNIGVRGKEGQSGSTVNQITDLRTGEILKADIIIGSSFQFLIDEYFVRCAPLDFRAREYPVPDDLKGELLQYVVAHEAGHAFGIKDAHYGEYAYPFERMRDRNWLRDMGHTPSIMSYARHNYIAQPKDNLPPSLLIQKVGPMDRYMIQWGYRTFPGTDTPKEELPYLETLVRQQDSIAWYRYNISQYEIIGPGSTNNVVDNNDPIGSTKLGLKNIQKVLDILSVMYKNGSIDRGTLERRYATVQKLWFQEMQHVLSLVGGYTIQYKSNGQNGAIYSPIPRDNQVAALEFLLQNAFVLPEWLSNPQCLSGLRYSTYPDRLIKYQQRLLRDLLDPQRMKRLENMEDSIQYRNITRKIMDQLQSMLFTKEVYIDRRGRSLQKTYIVLLIKAIDEEIQITNSSNYGYNDFSKSIFIEMLTSLKQKIENQLNRDLDQTFRGHLKNCLLLIENYFHCP